MKPIYRCTVCKKFVEEPIHCGKRAELILDGNRRVMLSKLMSYLLRHDPFCVGLRMSKDGWVDIGELVIAIKKRWRNAHLYQWLEPMHVIAVAMLDPKGRFEIKGNCIRARYGHNKRLGIEITYNDVDTHSKILFHGTSRTALQSILREGLKPMNRMYVHLSVTKEDACIVGKRHDIKPIVLYIDCECLRNHGYTIFVASNSVRLVHFVPPQCIKGFEYCSDN